jgi:hypothetical protein
MGGIVPPAPPLSKAEYATRLGVSPSAISKMIARHTLYPPALRDDGKIDPHAADRQLRRVIGEVHRVRKRWTPVVRLPPADRPPAPSAAEAQAALARAALLARVIGEVERKFFPVLVLELDLTFGQAEQLERAGTYSGAGYRVGWPNQRHRKTAANPLNLAA